jgi:hypothetical protein
LANKKQKQLSLDNEFRDRQLAAQIAMHNAEQEYLRKRMELVDLPGLEADKDKFAKQYALQMAQFDFQKIMTEKEYGLSEKTFQLKEEIDRKRLQMDQESQQFQQSVQNRQMQLNEANVTGFFGGQETLERQKFNEQMRQFNKDFGLRESSTTGYYNGQKTFDREKFEADQTGYLNGQSTLDRERLNLDRANAVLNAPRGPADYVAYMNRMRGVNGSGMMPGVVSRLFNGEQISGVPSTDYNMETPTSNTQYAMGMIGGLSNERGPSEIPIPEWAKQQQPSQRQPAPPLPPNRNPGPMKPKQYPGGYETGNGTPSPKLPPSGYNPGTYGQSPDYWPGQTGDANLTPGSADTGIDNYETGTGTGNANWAPGSAYTGVDNYETGTGVGNDYLGPAGEQAPYNPYGPSSGWNGQNTPRQQQRSNIFGGASAEQFNSQPDQNVQAARNMISNMYKTGPVQDPKIKYGQDVSIQNWKKLSPVEQEFTKGLVAEEGGQTGEDFEWSMKQAAPRYRQMGSARFGVR